LTFVPSQHKQQTVPLSGLIYQLIHVLRARGNMLTR